MTEEQFAKAVEELTKRIRNLNTELDKIEEAHERSSPRYGTLSATVHSYEHCLRHMFGDEWADKVINEAETGAAL